jgi:hypothetical protein
MKEDITKRDLAMANPFFIKQADNLIHFCSEGSYEVPLSRFEFYSLMDVTSSSDGTVQYLKWRLYPNLSANEAKDAAAKKKKAVTGLYLSQIGGPAQVPIVKSPRSKKVRKLQPLQK